MKKTQTHTGLPKGKITVFVQLGAFLSAVLASACCWLPLLLIVFGVSGSALSAKFEAWRPVLLPLTFALLGVAFYLTYRSPKTAVDPSDGKDGCGCSPDHAQGFPVNKLNKIVLWVVTVFVLAFAFFPNYVGLIFTAQDKTSNPLPTNQVTWVLTIEGMTCQGCAAYLQSELRKIPSVSQAEVDYKQAKAVVTTDSTMTLSEIQQAMSAVGYTVSKVEKDSDNKETFDDENESRRHHRLLQH